MTPFRNKRKEATESCGYTSKKNPATGRVRRQRAINAVKENGFGSLELRMETARMVCAPLDLSLRAES